jgi:predicted ATP-dependent endonuclease of OLD family
MIKSLEVRGLNQNKDLNLSFNNDLNLLTGKNGSGKTTIIKLIWLLISGNIDKLIDEVDFRYIKLVSSNATYELSIIEDSLHIKIDSADDSSLFGTKQEIDEMIPIEILRDIKRRAIAGTRLGKYRKLLDVFSSIPTQTILFPTFRRIEGGFSMGYSEEQNEEFYRRKNSSRIQSAMEDLTDELSNKNHLFIASISTKDIINKTIKQYAENSERVNALNIDLSEFITNKIHSDTMEDASKILNEIKDMVNLIASKREELTAPFTKLSDLIIKIFQYKGIKLTNKISFGEALDGTLSDKLSAGEKQMLSFIFYNSFSSDTIILIDEPEISLHIDWQRLLFPTLLSQNQSNQFIVTTHSPFIYSIYSDKEILLGTDRGE